jgi:GNAT superfamily N-acetyltransferase
MSIAQQISENFFRFREFYQGIPGAQIHRDGDVTLINTGIPCPGWNAIFSRKPAPQSIEQNMNQSLSFFQFPFSWWIGPEPEQRDLGKILQDYAFIAGETSAAMALDMKDFNFESSSGLQIEIRPVSNHKELEQFLQVLRRSFHMPLYAAEALFSLFNGTSLVENSKIYHYLGLYKGKTVGCASLFCTAEAAGIYYVGVLPVMRGMGIGKKMTIHCLKIAGKLGYKISVLRASNLGETVYRQLGFKDYGQFQFYRYVPDRLKGLSWKLNYYFNYVKDKFTGDAIWFS